MASPDIDDPFSWDEERVVKELCAPGCRWLLDSAFMETRLREHLIDGETLLTYEHLCGQKELWECLGMRAARHRAALQQAIVKWRSRSAGYRAWNQDIIPRIKHADPDDAKWEPVLKRDSDGPQENRQVSIPKAPNAYPADSGTLPQDDTVPPAAVENSTRAATESEQHVQAATDNPDVPDSISLPHIEPPQPQEEPSNAEDSAQHAETASKKRKRVAPITVSNQPINVSGAFIPTEADTLDLSVAYGVQKKGFPWETSDANAYLGDDAFPVGATRGSDGTLSSRLLDLDDGEFTVSLPNRLPPGLRRIAHHSVKRLLLKNSNREALERQGVVMIESPSPSETDSVVSISDLPLELDAETLQEIEDDREEDLRKESNSSRLPLSAERVQEILDEAILTMESGWRERKLPKHILKAHALWHSAHRKGTRRLQVERGHARIKALNSRITKMCAEIKGQEWPKEAPVRQQALCLEQSVEDRLYESWLLELLESRIEPPKPKKPLGPARSARARVDEELGEEILTSSEEDDFVISDDNGTHDDIGPYPMNGVAIAGCDAEENMNGFSKEETPAFIDLTQTDTPTTARTDKPNAFVDLTQLESAASTPIKTIFPKKEPETSDTPDGTDASNFPTVDSLGEFEQIGGVGATHWAKENDRWRLVVCVLWKLAHGRRRVLLEFIQTKGPGDMWAGSVGSYLQQPFKDVLQINKQESETAAFDITRVFLCFIRCQHYSESRVVNLSDKTKRKLEQARGSWFLTYCEFIKGIAPQFPDDSQIYRDEFMEDAEDDLMDEHLPDDSNNPSKSRRGAPKEIVQNKAALDLRATEQKRVQEQELRRNRLRANLANSDSMPRDKTRLIVNESKSDEESFIYLNEDIGRRIKSHQIDGVRFMWNQIMDPKIRQGCLLAHTMGLGKTMQIITLLVAIAEAVKSDDPSVRSQVPEELKSTQTLVLCPAGLVDNWMDEFLMWPPEGSLGNLRKITSVLSTKERRDTVRDWANGGGVLLIGYNMFSKMVFQEEEEEEANLLVDKPNIVIADEAHHLKNPTTKIHRASSRFKTKTRIALTGSPLANNVEEYHTMIDWVAPNFLGPLTEFREIYAGPIADGLYQDSSGSEKRNALKKLEALKKQVSPKVQRKTIKTMKDELPPKVEFVIAVPPTEIQKKLYQLYLDGLDQTRPRGKLGGVRSFGVANDLGLICGHPRCFHQRVKAVLEKGPEQGAENDQEDNTSFPMSIIQPALRELKVLDPNSPSMSLKVQLLTIILDESHKVGDKVLVFSHSLKTLDYLENLCRQQKRSFSRLDGKTPISQRQQLIKKFNSTNQQVYLICTTAGGVGLNIYGANRVVIFDFKWNPMHDMQAVGRAYRIGQKKPVFVYHFVVAGTFEEQLHNKHVFKMQLASRVVDKKNPVSWSNRNQQLFQPIKEVPAKDLTPFCQKDDILDKLIALRNDGEAIRSIVSTDTFEEEDPEVELTAAEVKEVDEMVNLNNLRTTNPDQYQQARQMLDYHGTVSLADITNPRRRSTVQWSNGCSDAMDPEDRGPPGLKRRDVMSSRAVAATSPALQREPPPQPTSGPVPLPVAGANTYFGEQPPATAPPGPSMSVFRVRSPRAHSSATQQSEASKGGNIFSQPLTQPRVTFQENLAKKIRQLQYLQQTGLDAAATAGQITDDVHAVRKEREFGFLPDNQHWKVLDELLVHDKFVLGLASMQISAKFVALANKKDLESRIHALNGVDHGDITAQASRKASTPDPLNLHNIQRPSMRYGGQSLLAKDDLKVMREAADNRKHRAFRLPTWANQALNDEKGRSASNQSQETSSSENQ